MKTRKRLLAGFLSLAMCLSLLPGTAWAAFGGAARIKSIAYGELMALPGNRAADSGNFTNSTSAPFIFVFREEDATVKSVTKDALATALSSGEGVTVSGQATRVVCLKYTEYSSLTETQQGYFAAEIRPGTESEYMTSTSEFWSAAPANDIAMTSYLSTYADTLKTNGFDPDNMEPLMKYVGHYNKYVHFAYVYWQKASTTSNTTPKITGADTSQLSLNSKTFNTYNVPVTTENLAGKTLTITETDADGTAKTTSSTGIAISSSATVGTDNTATLTLTTSTGLAGGTYYFKISADGAEDYTFSVDVEQSVTVNLSVTPTAAAGKWELVIQDLTGQSVQKTTAAVVAGEHYSFDLLQSNGTAYGSLTDHPTDGETYSDGSIYMPSMFKVTDSNNAEDNTVLTWTGLESGAPLNSAKITQYVTNMFTAPDHDINVEVEFVKAYPIAMGTVSGWDNYAEAEYPWQYYIANGYYYRPGDTVKDNSLISTIQKKVRSSGYVLKEVTVHKTGDTNTVVYQYLAENGTDEYFSFTMPEYPVSVSLVYAVDEEPLIASISDQTGTIIDGIASSATFEITTKNIPDGAKLTIQECGITGAAVSTPTSGLTLEVTSVQDNAATVTVKSDGTIEAGTVRFKLLYGDTMLNTIGSDVTTIAATVSDSSTKAVVIGTPSGELYAGSAGTLTFAGQVSNISDGSTVTVVETDAAGTPKTTNPTSGLTLSATTVSGKAFTITAETTAAVPQGTYYFKATADSTSSLVTLFTVGEAATKNLAVGTQQGSLAAGTAGSVTYAGTATNLSDGETLTVTETDANGTPKTVNQTAGLTISASSVTSEQFTVTVSTTAAVQAGTYYFVVSLGDPLKSGVVAITVASASGVTVTFAGGGGTANEGAETTISATPGSSITLPPSMYAREGYVFKDWDGNAVGASYTVPSGGATLTATWTAVSTVEPEDVTQSLEGITKDNAADYKPQIEDAVEALAKVVTSDTVSSSTLSETQDLIEEIEKLYTAANTTGGNAPTATVTGNASTNVTQNGAILSSGGTHNVELKIETVSEDARKAIPAEYQTGYTAAYREISLYKNNVYQPYPDAPIVITLPIPSELSAATVSTLRILHYEKAGDSYSDTPTEITYLLSNNGKYVVFVMDSFSPVTFVAKKELDPPVLSNANVTRLDATSAQLSFDSSKAGTFYYVAVTSGATQPAINTSGAGVDIQAGSNTIKLTGLTADAMDIWFVAKEAASDGDDVGTPSKVSITGQTGGTTYLVNSATYQNGYVSISKQAAAEGETITLTAQPNTGYALATISVTKTEGSAVTLSGTGNTRTFTMPASDVTVNATFASSVTTYPVKVSTVPNGTITVSPTEAAEGATVTVTVTPNSGYQMVAGSLKYSEASAGGAVVTISGNTFTMPGIEVSVSCQFEAVTAATESPVSITSFMINGVSAAINNESRIITIVLPYGTDLSAVAPVITGVNIERIRPDSAQLVDLRSPRTYTVYSTDGTRVSYTVAAYTEDPTPAMQLWENLQDHIDSTDNWWELAEYQKITGYYGNNTSGQTLYSLQTYLDDITAQYGTKRTTLNCYYYGGRLMLEPASYSMSGTSYSNTLDLPRKTLSNLSDLGYSIVTYNLRELQVDIYEKMETTKGFEITVSAPSSSIRNTWNKLSGSGHIFEIEASSTNAGLVLRIPVGEVLKSELSLMKYDATKARFVEMDRDDWYMQDGYLVTGSVSAGIYGLQDR